MTERLKVGWLVAVLLAAMSCSDDAQTGDESDAFVVVTFNAGTTEDLPHDDPPDDGYTSDQAAISDEHYGDGLAWLPAVDAVRAFVQDVAPDVITFQEIFYSEECADIPSSAYAGFVCEAWEPGDQTVAEVVLGEGYQIACHPGRPDKCAAVRREFGRFVDCDDDFCVEGLAGFSVDGCGSGARVARGVVERMNGDRITLVSVHGTSGFTPDDQQCRVQQVEQVFVDAGDGEPAANGARNLILGDFNTDPFVFAGSDPSADRWNDFVADDGGFSFISRVGPGAPRAYLDTVDIDHVVSDSFSGSCRYPGVDPENAPVYEGRYFDHVPVVCEVSEGSP